MHIVFLTNIFPLQGEVRVGSGNYVANMARILNENGHKVTILTESAKRRISTWNGITIRKVMVGDSGNSENSGWIRNTYNIIKRSLCYKYAVEKLNKVEPIDIVQSISTFAISLMRTGDIPYVVRVSELPALWRESNHTDFNFKQCQRIKRLDDEASFWAFRRADEVIVPSILLQKLIKQKTGIVAQIVESPVLVGQNEYALNEENLEPNQYFLTFGSLMARKETHILANIIDQVLDEYPKMKYVVIGRNQELEYMGQSVLATRLFYRTIKRHRDRFVFLGEIADRDRLFSLIDNACICVLPTRVDNLPNTCLEAMALGKIVISTTSNYGTSMEQLITDSYNGFLAKVDDERDLLKKIRQAMGLSREEKELMEKRALQRVSNLSPREVYPIMMQIYKKIIHDFQDRSKKHLYLSKKMCKEVKE